MEALIDGDIVAYRCAATAENEDVMVAYWRIDDLIDRILKETKASSFRIFISGRRNFRHNLFPAYKANRIDKPRPLHLDACKDHLVYEYKASVSDNVEADDDLGINQTENTIICSIDKDLKQVPGLHYNFVKGEMSEVSPFQGLYQFYSQMLIGDKSDNVPGVTGIGEKKTYRALSDCTSEEELFDVVRDLYKDDARMLLTGKLLWILKQEEGIWTHPKLPESLLLNYIHPFLLEGEVKLGSTPTQEQETNPSTEPISQEKSGFLPVGEQMVATETT